MAWEIEWSGDALADLESLEISTRKRILKKVEQAKDSPARNFQRLVGYEDYRLRIGDYRIIALLDLKKSVIHIERIGQRKNIYRMQ